MNKQYNEENTTQNAVDYEFISQLQRANEESLLYDGIIENYRKLLSKYINGTTLYQQKKIEVDKLVQAPTTEGVKSSKEYKELYAEFEDLKKKVTEQVSLRNKSLSDIFVTKQALEKSTKSVNSFEKEIETITQKLTTTKQLNAELSKQLKELIQQAKDPIKLGIEIQGLTDSITKLNGQNQMLIHKIKSHEDRLSNQQEYNKEINDATEKKKIMTRIAFDTDENEYRNMIQNIKNDFQISLENCIIPKSLKVKSRPHKKGVTSIFFNAIGTNFITTGIDNFVKNWDCSKNTEISSFSGFTGAVSEAVYDHSDQFLFAGSMDKTAKLWALKNNKLQCTYTGHIDYINCVRSFYSSVKAITGSSDRTLKEWDFNTSKLSRNFSCQSGCHSLSISSDDSFIISGHLDGSVKLWSSNEKPEEVMDLHDDKVLHLELIKNETQFLTLSK